MCDLIIGLFGAIVGAVTALAGTWLTHYLQQKQHEKIDQPRRALLLEMLENPPPGNDWRKLETLCGVIGATPAETTRLLIEIGARGSESGNDTWALKSKHPFKH